LGSETLGSFLLLSRSLTIQVFSRGESIVRRPSRWGTNVPRREGISNLLRRTSKHQECNLLTVYIAQFSLRPTYLNLSNHTITFQSSVTDTGGTDIQRVCTSFNLPDVQFLFHLFLYGQSMLALPSLSKPFSISTFGI
jgi:hypothetical protein